MTPPPALPVLALVVALALLPGCLREGAEDVRVTPAAFTQVDAEWVGLHAGGCGMCLGAGGFERPAEHAATFVFRDGRALSVEWNNNVSADGGFHVAPGVDFDADRLRALVALSDRARGEVFVLRVTTGNVTPADAVVDRLDESWAPPATAGDCTDYGAEYAHRTTEGAVRKATVTCPVEVEDGHPLHAYASTMHAVGDGLRDLPTSAAP